jgi:hypothetical protein
MAAIKLYFIVQPGEVKFFFLMKEISITKIEIFPEIKKRNLCSG